MYVRCITCLRLQRKIHKPRKEEVEQCLARARAAIRKAASSKNLSSPIDADYVPTGGIYHNPSAFYQ